MSPGYLEESTVGKQRVPTLVLPALAICFLACRLISRKLKRLSFGVDDYTLILGLVGGLIHIPSSRLTVVFRSLLYRLRGSIMLVRIHSAVYPFASVATLLTVPATYYGMGRHMAAVMREGFDMVTYMKVSPPNASPEFAPTPGTNIRYTAPLRLRAPIHYGRRHHQILRPPHVQPHLPGPQHPHRQLHLRRHHPRLVNLRRPRRYIPMYTGEEGMATTTSPRDLH